MKDRLHYLNNISNIPEQENGELNKLSEIEETFVLWHLIQ